MNSKVIILGGGISGLSVAWRLAENDFPVEVIELNEYWGGLSGSVRENGYIYDIGPHYIESEYESILEKIKSIFEYEIPVKDNVKVKLYINNKFVDFPFTAKSVLFQMGVKSSTLCLTSYIKSAISNLWKHTKEVNDNQNIEEWAINNFGEYLFDIFFKPYTENFWKISSKELSNDAVPTSRKMSFLRTLEFLVIRPLKRKDDTFNLIERGDLTYYYPKRGFGEIPERIASLLGKYGGNLHLGWKVDRVEKLPDGDFITTIFRESQTKEIKGKYVISTIPLNKLIPMLRPIPKESILQASNNTNYLSLITIYLITTKQNILEHDLSYWLNRPYHRLSEANKFSYEISPPGENMLCAEVSCYEGDGVWNLTDRELFDRCIPYLESDGILKKEEVKDIHVLRIPEAYPVYKKDYKKNLDLIFEHISKIENLETIGRLGTFIYGAIDLDMKRGFDIADKIISREQK